MNMKVLHLLVVRCSRCIVCCDSAYLLVFISSLWCITYYSCVLLCCSSYVAFFCSELAMAQQPSPYRVRLNLCRFLGISLAYPALLLSMCVLFVLLSSWYVSNGGKNKVWISRISEMLSPSSCHLWKPNNLNRRVCGCRF